MGPQANNSHHLRSVAFSVFSRCRPTLKLLREAQALTGFCPANKRRQPNFNVSIRERERVQRAREREREGGRDFNTTSSLTAGQAVFSSIHSLT